MKMMLKLLRTTSTLIITSLTGCGLITNRETYANPAAQNQGKTANKCLVPDPLNPHWSEKDRFEWHQEYLRQTRGYKSAIKLALAVAQFNEDAQCHEPIGKNQPPLTVQEVLTAVRDINDHNTHFPTLTKKQFEMILKELVMPKGSLLWYDWGYRQNWQDGVLDMHYWKIYLYVELDKYPLDEKVDYRLLPKYKHLIRLQYISSELTK